MKDFLKKTWRENPKIRKCVGAVMVVLGLISVITPFTPFGFLLVVGLEILGVRVLFWDKIKKWFSNRKGPEPDGRMRRFYIRGMHCQSCVILTESEIGALPNVKSAKTDLAGGFVEIDGDFGERTSDDIAEELTGLLSKQGYAVSPRPFSAGGARWSEFKIAVPMALVFALLFVLLQKAGVVNLVRAEAMSYGAAFFIGVVASLSTCMAVVGGLVLSLSAMSAKQGGRARSQIVFHVGRIVAFFVLGGAVGVLGGFFALNANVALAINILVGIIMLVLGISLLDVFPSVRKFLPSMPRSISGRFFGISKAGGSLAPFLTGVATFFLPCGFTQSMQFYALTTGSFLKGGLTMLVFALGTLPVLALIGFGSFRLASGPKAGIFFKTAGLIVIMFALLSLAGALVVSGVIPPFFNL